LNSRFASTSTIPIFNVTGYVYSSSAGYIDVQRQFGVQTGTAAAGISINVGLTTITFTNITKASNFPATANDPSGFALYILFQILN
jgi:hypothetical protein